MCNWWQLKLKGNLVPFSTNIIDCNFFPWKMNKAVKENVFVHGAHLEFILNRN